MKKILTSFIVLVSVGQITGQTTTTTQSGKTETYTRTETLQPNGQTIITTTHTSTVNMDASFGIKLNVNMSNVIIRDNDCQSKMKLGFSTGVFLKLESNAFALQYELLLRHKNFAVKNAETNTQTDYSYWGLELPIYFMGQIKTGAGKIFIGAGPYVSIGLDGKQDPGNIDIYKNDKTSGKPIMKRFDFGLGAMCGYEFNNGISVSGGYQAGLINALSAQKDTMTMKNQCVNFGVGYKF